MAEEFLSETKWKREGYVFIVLITLLATCSKGK